MVIIFMCYNEVAFGDVVCINMGHGTSSCGQSIRGETALISWLMEKLVS